MDILLPPTGLAGVRRELDLLPAKDSLRACWGMNKLEAPGAGCNGIVVLRVGCCEGKGLGGCNEVGLTGPSFDDEDASIAELMLCLIGCDTTRASAYILSRLLSFCINIANSFRLSLSDKGGAAFSFVWKCSRPSGCIPGPIVIIACSKEWNLIPFVLTWTLTVSPWQTWLLLCRWHLLLFPKSWYNALKDGDQSSIAKLRVPVRGYNFITLPTRRTHSSWSLIAASVIWKYEKENNLTEGENMSYRKTSKQTNPGCTTEF